MSSILTKIQAYKLEEIAHLKSSTGYKALEREACAQPRPRGFTSALKRRIATGYAIIAEIKKASPSKGLIRPHFNPVQLAQSYGLGGATCLSVLTDAPGFQGQTSDLTEVAGAVSMPVLRKDFMLDPIQVLEARALRADCILIIMAMVDDATAQSLEQTAQDWGMDVLLEVHTEEELHRALQLQSNLIGMNNRDLHTFTVNLDTSRTLVKLLPEEKIAVSESGISTPSDLDSLAEDGIKCFLIGESLMRQGDVQQALECLLASPQEDGAHE